MPSFKKIFNLPSLSFKVTILSSNKKHTHINYRESALFIRNNNEKNEKKISWKCIMEI